MTAENERLSADDQATEREALFLAEALEAQRKRAARLAAQPGVCAFCGEPCLPQAVYCDSDCRFDHERELVVLRRQGLQRRPQSGPARPRDASGGGGE